MLYKNIEIIVQFPCFAMATLSFQVGFLTTVTDIVEVLFLEYDANNRRSHFHVGSKPNVLACSTAKTTSASRMGYLMARQRAAAVECAYAFFRRTISAICDPHNSVSHGRRQDRRGERGEGGI